MEWLNYHHLLYFWAVAKEGSVTAACEQLGLAQPTISTQIAALEKDLGVKLFERAGRNLVLSETGRVVFEYAEQIFSMGRELMNVVKGRSKAKSLRVVVGIADVLPKLIVYRLLEPVYSLPQEITLICQEDKPERLMAELALHNLDLVLTDTQISSNIKVKAYHHLLGECGITFFTSKKYSAKLREGFPQSLNGHPFLYPMDNTALRRALDQWFDSQGIYPVMRGEFADTALLKVFGEAGIGCFAVPSAIEAEVVRQFGVEEVGRTQDVKERFYAVTIDRRLKHPAVMAIFDKAKKDVFAN